MCKPAKRGLRAKFAALANLRACPLFASIRKPWSWSAFNLLKTLAVFQPYSNNVKISTICSAVSGKPAYLRLTRSF